MMLYNELKVLKFYTGNLKIVKNQKSTCVFFYNVCFQKSSKTKEQMLEKQKKALTLLLIFVSKRRTYKNRARLDLISLEFTNHSTYIFLDHSFIFISTHKKVFLRFLTFHCLIQSSITSHPHLFTPFNPTNKSNSSRATTSIRNCQEWKTQYEELFLEKTWSAKQKFIDWNFGGGEGKDSTQTSYFWQQGSMGAKHGISLLISYVTLASGWRHSITWSHHRPFEIFFILCMYTFVSAPSI